MLPVAVPLPPGHNLDPVRFMDSVGLNDFLERLQTISQELAEWAAAITKTWMWWGGDSLHLPRCNIPLVFMEGLPTVIPNRKSIRVSVSPVSPDTIGQTKGSYLPYQTSQERQHRQMVSR